MPRARRVRAHRFQPDGAAYVVVSDDAVTVTLANGRLLSTPLEWYPRLASATPTERNHWELIGRGIGIHWPGHPLARPG